MLIENRLRRTFSVGSWSRRYLSTSRVSSGARYASSDVIPSADLIRVVDDVFTESAPVQPNKKFKAVYKFHEGSSSAVRKNIKMSALM